MCPLLLDPLVFDPYLQVFKLLCDLCLSVSQTSPLDFKLSLSLTAYRPGLSSPSTLDPDLLDVHAHHIPLEDAADLPESGGATSDQHGPRVFKPG